MDTRSQKSPAQKPNHSSKHHIGFSIIDITPPLDLNVRLGGYLRFHKVAKKVLHPMKARAFCIKNESDLEKSVILISVDLVGGQYRWIRLVRKIISRRTGVPIANIILHFTHSHTTPDMIGIFPNKIGNFPRTDVQYPVLKHIMKYIIKSGVSSYQNANQQFKIGFGWTKNI